MELEKLTASDFQAMVIAGAERLSENVDLINALNVFPVPDGDTGTNMNMSFQSGVENLRQAKTEHIGELSQALAKGLLMGARGNSGVILSQIFRGFFQAIKDKETLNSEEFVSAFVGGVESAYKAVMKPVEGTILTVARESAIRGEKKAAKTQDIIEIMGSIVRGASQSLDRTPDLLPVLKQVGVVDSGGKGLLCIYEGFLAALTGEVVIDAAAEEAKSEHSHAIFEADNDMPLSMEDITYGYCTEIMVRIGEGPTAKKDFNYDEFRNLLNTKGDSLLVVNDDEIVKVHVHTENPGEIMQLGQEFGELIKIKVDNMREQVRGLEAEDQAMQADKHAVAPTELKPFAVIAVAAGEGMKELFESIGVDQVLSGGQTMNPSTEDFIKLIEACSAENIVILPNNKNIIMAAEQAAEVTDKPTVVIPTTTIPQGIASMLAYNPAQTIEENKVLMTESSQTVVSGQITYSIRDTEIDGVSITKDDYMGLIDGKIVLSEPSIETALTNTIERIISDDMELITIIIGEDGDTELAEAVAAKIEAAHSDVEIEFVQGDQPVYHYILSAE